MNTPPDQADSPFLRPATAHAASAHGLLGTTEKTATATATGDCLLARPLRPPPTFLPGGGVGGHVSPSRYGQAPSGKRQRTGDGTRPFPQQPPHPSLPLRRCQRGKTESGRGRRDRPARPAAPRARRRMEGRRGGAAGQGCCSSAVSTETPARAALATQRGPAAGRKILGGGGRGGGVDLARRRINQATSVRSPPPAAPRLASLAHPAGSAYRPLASPLFLGKGVVVG